MQRWLPILFYIFIVVLIMAPLFAPGYLFLLDFVVGPKISLAKELANGVNASLPLTIFLKGFSFFLPTQIIQKLLLSGILFTAGTSMFWLAKKYLPTWWAFAAGFFYLFNPSVYERFLAGHWLVLAGYALFPFVVLAWITLLEKQTKKLLVLFAIFFAVYPIFSQHWAYIAFWMVLLIGAAHLSLTRQWFMLKKQKTWLCVGLIAVVWLVVNSFWLLNFWSPKSVFPKITLADFSAYATQPDPRFGAVFTVLSLYGFWQTQYFLPKDFLPYWWLVTPIILSFTLAAFWLAWQKKHSLGVALSIAFLPMVLVAAGFGSAETKPIVIFLFHIVPGFSGLRETAKLVGLIAFCYALLIPYGVYFLTRSFGRAIAMVGLAAVLVVPICMTAPMLWGFAGQIAPANYPAGWYTANRLIGSKQNVLFLPWHGYLILPFAKGHLVANPAPVFFASTIIAGKGLDNAYVADNDTSVWDNQLFQILQQEESPAAFGQFLQQHHVSSVVLANVEDSDRYGFLTHTPNLSLQFQDASIRVYRVQ